MTGPPSPTVDLAADASASHPSCRCRRRGLRWLGVVLGCGTLATGLVWALHADTITASQLLALAGSTFISEDLACIGAGLLVHEGTLTPLVAICGCALGIFVGDAGLMLLGRFGWRGAKRLSFVTRRLGTHRPEALGAWLDSHLIRTIITARFIPGTRVPTYLAVGALGRRLGMSILLLGAGTLLWTPLLVLAVAWLGAVVAEPLQRLFGEGWMALVIAAVALVMALHVAIRLSTAQGRRKMIVTCLRLTRYEFWPIWMLYAPLVPVWAWLSIRYRGTLSFTAANPAMPHGGMVGESKSDILAATPPERVASFALLPAGATDERMTAMNGAMGELGLCYPVILKPDAGYRGASVRLIRDAGQAAAYLQDHDYPILLQQYHPGPHEAGIFYYRHPDEPTGRIFGITDKKFPHIIGDGKRTLEQLIHGHPRYRLQADRFLERFDDRREKVLCKGQSMRLAMAGNHCQGVMFLDGASLLTPELESAIDQVLRQIEGFHFGRLDVRYSDVAAFKAGTDWTIIEINGVSSEATNLYDPSWTLFGALATLARQWHHAYRIGWANRRRGHAVSSWPQLIGEIRRYRSKALPDPVSD